MKPSEVCLLQGGQLGKVGSIEVPPRSLLADVLSIVVLLLIGTGLIVDISRVLQKKNVAPKVDTAQLNAQTTEQRPVETKPEPALFDPTARSTSGYRSSLPTSSLVIKGFPGSPYQPPVTSKSALRRFASESDAKQRSAVGKKSAENRDSTRKWPKFGGSRKTSEKGTTPQRNSRSQC
jgi:hypothetical protein